MKALFKEPRKRFMGKFNVIECEGTYPVIEVRRGHKPTLKEMADATEEFRVKKVMALCKSGNDDKARRKAIEYLLKCWDKLAPNDAADVINQANKMLQAKGVDEDVKIGIAIAIKNFTGVKDSKKETTLTFEQMLEKGGHVEIDEDGQHKTTGADESLL